MGLRVTTRSRADGPFPYTVTTASASEDDGLTGPFTASQMSELLYRIRAVSVNSEVDHSVVIDPPPESPPFTETTTSSDMVTATHRIQDGFSFVELEDELQLMEYFGSLLFMADSSSVVVEVVRQEMRRDETGGYWVPVRVTRQVSSDVLISYPDAAPFQFEFDALLELSGATFNIPSMAVGLDVTSATCVITPAEYWPYATTTGAAAWNTTTGAPVNGGPGA